MPKMYGLESFEIAWRRLSLDIVMQIIFY